MRRLCLFLTIFALLSAASFALAQDTVSPTPISAQDLYALATQVAEQAQRSQNAMADAQRYAQDASDSVSKYMDTANNLLGLFQNVTAVAGVIIPLLALLAATSALGRLNSAQKDLAEARDQFEADIKVKQAELLALRQELERVTAQQREYSTHANLASSFTALGERQYRAKDFSGAIDTYRRALELDPNNVITHYRLGYVYTQSGQLEQAEHHLNRVLEIEPKFAPALAALGYVYRRMGEKMPESMEHDRVINRAETLLLQALDLSPKLVDEDGESWWGSLGGLYRRRHQINEAIHAYEQAAEVTPQSSYAFSNLALLYMQKQNRDAMLKTYHRVEQLAFHEVQAEVDNYWAYADLLTSRLALGKVKEAEETLASVLDVAPPESPFFFESLLDTLRRLVVALGEDSAGHVQRAIEIIEGYRDQKAKQDGQAAQS